MHIASAVIAGVTVSSVTNPIWVVKTRVQLQTRDGAAAPKYTSSFDCARKMFREEGLRSFYKGLMASYVGKRRSTLGIFCLLRAAVANMHALFCRHV